MSCCEVSQQSGGRAKPICVGLLLARVGLGLFLFLAGYMKVFQMGVSEFYEKGFLGLKPAWLPEWFASPYGHAIPYLELIVGALLILGLFFRLASIAFFFMLLSFTIALFVKTQSFSLGGQGMMHTNWVLLPVCLLLSMTGPGRASLDALCCCSKKEGGCGTPACCGEEKKS